MEGFLEWTRLSIANLQPEKKTAGPWAPREVGLIFLSMNGKADTEGGALEQEVWARQGARGALTPAAPLILQPQHLKGVVQWLLGACQSDRLLL